MAEKEKKGRRFSADEKLAIIEEARAPNTTVAEVLRRHQVDGATFYHWEKQAKAAIREALGKPAGGKPGGGGGASAADRAKDQRIARLEADLERKKGIIAEVVEENLLLKRGL
ncbi:MAG: transposase [Gemmatimonadaceae bacterium]